MSATVQAGRCPVAHRSCPGTPPCPAALPSEGRERAAILILRFIAAARETGDACCWDAALDQAEVAFGERRAAFVVAHACALIRRLGRSGIDIGFLPPPCRRLSSGETLLLGALLQCETAASELAVDPVMENVAALARSIAAPDPMPRQIAA